MYKNKVLITALASATVWSSMFAVGHANGVTKETVTDLAMENTQSLFSVKASELKNVPISKEKTVMEQLLKEQQVLSTRLYSTEFTALPLNEKLTFMTVSFQLQKSIHDQHKKTIMSTTSATDLDGIESYLKVEQLTMEREMKILEEIFINSSAEQQELKTSAGQLKETVTALQGFRSSGMELRDLLYTQQQKINGIQMTTLMQVVTSSLKEQKHENAKDSLVKMIQLTKGDIDYVAFLEELLEKEEGYILLEHKLFKISKPFLKIEQDWYMPASEIKNIIETTKVNDQKEILIMHGNKEISLKKEAVLINGINIGISSLLKEDNETSEQLVNVTSLFKLLGYDVSMSSKKDLLNITTELYPRQFIDDISVEDMLKSII